MKQDDITREKKQFPTHMPAFDGSLKKVAFVTAAVWICAKRTLIRMVTTCLTYVSEICIETQ